MGWDTPQYAIITGASSGIGAAFAEILASQGFNLLLVDIQEDLLQQKRTEIQKNANVYIETVVADLSNEETLIQLKQQLESRTDIDLLVNNAGFGSRGHFAFNNFDRQLAMLKVHNLAPVYLTRAVLPGMIKRDRGVIINLSSLGGFLPSAGAVMYSSTKAFIRMFTESIALEVQKTNVRIEAICPGFTHTGFHSTEEKKDFDKSTVPGFLWMNAEEVVHDALVGVVKQKIVLVPRWKNKLLKWLQTSRLTRKAAMQKTVKTAQKI